MGTGSKFLLTPAQQGANSFRQRKKQRLRYVKEKAKENQYAGEGERGGGEPEVGGFGSTNQLQCELFLPQPCNINISPI